MTRPIQLTPDGSGKPIIAIDPGPTESAFVVWDGETILNFGKWDNQKLLEWLRRASCQSEAAVIERIASYGMAVGAEVFETCVWTGRFMQEYGAKHVRRVERREVKLQMCRDSRAKDANIRQAIIDRFGGKENAIGKKASPGPLYGIKADCWQALALALTWTETKGLVKAI